MPTLPSIPMLRRCALSAGLALCFTSFQAQAAGGHHSVDDAAILDAGQCESEAWFGRATGNERLLHAGLGCRVGPVELGLASEHTRASGASATGWGLEVKWAMPVADGWSVGVAVAPVWQAHVRPRYQGTGVTGLVTWSASEQLALHANLGRDLVHAGPDETRWGVAAEWTSSAGWSAVAERYRESASHFVRVGARWSLGEQWSMDLSRAQRLSGAAPSQWTLGVTWLIEKR